MDLSFFMNQLFYGISFLLDVRILALNDYLSDLVQLVEGMLSEALVLFDLVSQAHLERCPICKDNQW